MSGHGRVFLIGAGPGDPELLTVKALRLLQTADVVVYDRLVSPEILAMAPDAAARVYVGKQTGHHHCTQDRINDILFHLARQHRRVVRLKGGDPFIFGRGGEEALHLKDRGIEVEVVPGITSAAACAAAAQVPLTHRGLATGVRFVTGHARSDGPLDLDWAGLADPDTTLVIYMGLGTLADISARLIAHGLPGDTPVLAVENGTTPRERRLATTIAKATTDLDAAGFRPPTMLVVGRVAALAEIATAGTDAVLRPILREAAELAPISQAVAHA